MIFFKFAYRNQHQFSGRDHKSRRNHREEERWAQDPRRRACFVKKVLVHRLFQQFLQTGKTGIEFCTGAVEYMGNRVIVEGLENIPVGERYTFVSNHPVGGVEGVFLAGIIGTRFGSVRIPMNDFLLAMPGLRPISIPVSKTGNQSRELPALINAAFDSENQMLLFPAGLCSRLIDGKIQDLPWGKAFISQSVRTQRAVVPIHFYGENSRSFYLVAKLCKLMHLKFNVAMAFLPRETYKKRGRTFKVVFGPPVPYTVFDKSRTPSEWAGWVREEVYKL